MEKHLRHCRLVSALRAPIQAKVSGLEGHLDEGIRAEAVAGDEVLAISPELERLTIVLAYQITYPRLGEPNTPANLGKQLPLQFARRRIDAVFGRSSTGFPLV